MGIGFAVLSSTTRRIVDQIVADGRADHARIGATLIEVSGDERSTGIMLSLLLLTAQVGDQVRVE